MQLLSLCYVWLHNCLNADGQFGFCLFLHISVDLVIGFFFCLELCNLFTSNAFFLFISFFLPVRCVFCLSDTILVGFVWFTLTWKGHEETLKSQNSLPLSYLLHVNPYTMSNHAIVCVWVCLSVSECVCARVGVYDNMCVCVYIHQTQIYS